MLRTPTLRFSRLTRILAGCVLVASPIVARADDAKKPIDVGLQLYSLRGQFLVNGVPKTLDTVEGFKITDVECASTYQLSAQQFREELDKHHLHASGAHYQWDRLDKDIDGVIAEAKTLGCEYVTCPWVPHGATFTEADARRAIEKFNAWGKKFADAGLKFTYHAHGYEFVPFQDGTLFDLMAKEIKHENANFELDIFWAYDGGADPVKLMEKYPTRFLQMHLKDMDKSVKVPKYQGHEDVKNDVALGTGQLDMPAILAEAQKIGIKHFYIEDESPRSVEQIPQSIAYIRSQGY